MKLAQIGYGYWGKNLTRVFSSGKDAQLVLCCENNPKSEAVCRETYPSIETCSDINIVLKRKEIDGVIIATPAGSHYEHAKRVLNAGKHVFVEKPLALTVAEAEEIVSIAEKQSLILMVGHTFLYNDAVRWIKDFIDRGEMGEIYYTYFQRLSLGRLKTDINAMWNLAPHDISIALYWYGETPVKVEAQGISYLQKGIDDVNFLGLYFKSGRFAHIHVSWLDPVKTRRAIVVGSRKMVLYDDTAADRRITVFDKGIDLKTERDGMGSIPFDNFAQFNLIQRTGDIVIPQISFREPLEVEAEHFVHCIKNGEKPLTDGRSGLDVVRTLEAAQTSCKSSSTSRCQDL